MCLLSSWQPGNLTKTQVNTCFFVEQEKVQVPNLRFEIHCIKVCCVSVLQDRRGQSEEVWTVLAFGGRRAGGLWPYGSGEPKGGPPHPLQPHHPWTAQHWGTAMDRSKNTYWGGFNFATVCQWTTQTNSYSKISIHFPFYSGHSGDRPSNTASAHPSPLAPFWGILSCFQPSWDM